MLHQAPKELSLYTSASDEFRKEIMRYAAMADIPAGTLICNEGKFVIIYLYLPLVTLVSIKHRNQVRK